MKKIVIFLSLFLIVLYSLSACAPQPEENEDISLEAELRAISEKYKDSVDGDVIENEILRVLRNSAKSNISFDEDPIKEFEDTMLECSLYRSKGSIIAPVAPKTFDEAIEHARKEYTGKLQAEILEELLGYMSDEDSTLEHSFQADPQGTFDTIRQSLECAVEAEAYSELNG